MGYDSNGPSTATIDPKGSFAAVDDPGDGDDTDTFHLL